LQVLTKNFYCFANVKAVAVFSKEKQMMTKLG
jgi:hypothetical protein